VPTRESENGQDTIDQELPSVSQLSRQHTPQVANEQPYTLETEERL